MPVASFPTSPVYCSLGRHRNGQGFLFLDKHVLGMALLRLFSAGIELSAALLMLKLNRVEDALRINAALSLVGPTVLLTVTAVGLAGLAGRVPFTRLVLVVAGVALIFYAVGRR